MYQTQQKRSVVTFLLSLFAQPEIRCFQFLKKKNKINTLEQQLDHCNQLERSLRTLLLLLLHLTSSQLDGLDSSLIHIPLCGTEVAGLTSLCHPSYQSLQLLNTWRGRAPRSSLAPGLPASQQWLLSLIKQAIFFSFFSQVLSMYRKFTMEQLCLVRQRDLES